VAATRQAAEQAHLKAREIDGEVGVIIGSSVGGITTVTQQMEAYRQRGFRAVSPFTVPMMMPDAASAQASIALGADGPNFCTTSACASSADGIGAAYEMIKRGDVQVMVTGGSDAAITVMGIGAFNAARALSTRNDKPQEASRPFDAQRDGFIMGEGAAVLILEGLEVAVRRGAPILAEIIGYGASSDARHMAQPDEEGRGAAKAMRLCIQRAGKKPEDFDYINAHGTSTPWNDVIETKAIKTVFGEHAYRIPASSTKSMMGHLLGAAGAIEAIACILAIRNGIIPPTINYQYPDPKCDLDYVPNTARKARVRVTLSNSFGFGGHNSVLAFQEYTG
jgi:beta-ketoacyl-acyl-carrier-protein synthase II